MLSSAAVAAAVAAAAAAVAARVCRSGPDAVHSRLLSWAGQVLCCHLHDAYLLGPLTFYSKVCGRLDDMLLISLGITQRLGEMWRCWCACGCRPKLEGHRRQVAGCSKLGAGAATHLLVGDICGAALDAAVGVGTLLRVVEALGLAQLSGAGGFAGAMWFHAEGPASAEGDGLTGHDQTAARLPLVQMAQGRRCLQAFHCSFTAGHFGVQRCLTAGYCPV